MTVKDLSKQVDGFIEDLFQEIYSIPLYGKQLSGCDRELYDSMERITLNNPQISGVTINNKEHHPICSTLPSSDVKYSSSVHTRAILGPYKLPFFDQPIYLIEQKIGNYSIDLTIVSAVLKEALETSNELSTSVVLHDQFNRKNIIRVEHNDSHDGWVVSKNLESRSPLRSDYLFGVDKLQSVDGISIAVFENRSTVLTQLIYSEVLIVFLVLLLSLMLYISVSHSISKHYTLHGAMKLAIRNREFYPEFQPIFDNKENCFAGVEVLMRWQDQQDKIIMPDFFIEEAEATGLIVPITLQIVETSFQQTQELLKKNPKFHLGFNLSLLHFKDANFFAQFYNLQQQYAIASEQILLEITERDLLDKNDSIFVNRMRELREAGFSLAVDDFGTGHASISYLQSFPFNYLKIDKLFIHAIGTHAITESLNDAIIQMAKTLNLIIVAEGVETQEQVDYLFKNGVRFLQGWYFSKAVPIKVIYELLEENNNA
jgi:sensor c-di-GMP phosphodiesterase-like protein